MYQYPLVCFCYQCICFIKQSAKLIKSSLSLTVQLVPQILFVLFFFFSSGGLRACIRSGRLYFSDRLKFPLVSLTAYYRKAHSTSETFERLPLKLRSLSTHCMIFSPAKRNNGRTATLQNKWRIIMRRLDGIQVSRARVHVAGQLPIYTHTH